MKLYLVLMAKGKERIKMKGTQNDVMKKLGLVKTGRIIRVTL